MLNRLLSTLLLFGVAAIAQAQSVVPVTVAKGLSHPWAVAFLPNGNFLVSERSGALRVIEPDGKIGQPVRGLPAIAVDGQGGLLDVVLDSDFPRNRMLYFCFSEPDSQGSGNSTALASARLSSDMR